MARNRLQTYQLKVTLEEIRPPIWRRILVPGNTTLLKLHDILQIVMGWRDYHLHLFMIAGEEYGDPGLDEFGDWPLKNEARYKLSQLIPGEGFRFHYEYDFGDSWRHLLLVEKILPAGPDARQPLCLKGKRACPPEDVGGAWGYEGFLEALRDPGHSEHEAFLEWLGVEFDPEAFDLDKVNDVLRRMDVGRSTAALSPWPSEVVETDFFDAPPAWLARFPDADRATAEELPLRRDVITLLTYLRDNRVTGTQATGNLPLKAVREITRQFVEPPILEHRIGDQVFAVRSEMEVWPLQFVHVLAAIGGLVMGGLGQRWRLTELGERFLAAPALSQVAYLSVTWWQRINWAIASPYEIMDLYLLDGFPAHTRQALLAAGVETPVPFGPFADRLAERTGLTWSGPDEAIGRMVVRGIIERMAVLPLADLGILQTAFGPDEILGERYPAPVSFQVTAFGRRLLPAMKDREDAP
jgi:hypothetical protein